MNEDKGQKIVLGARKEMRRHVIQIWSAVKTQNKSTESMVSANLMMYYLRRFTARARAWRTLFPKRKFLRQGFAKQCCETCSEDANTGLHGIPRHSTGSFNSGNYLTKCDIGKRIKTGCIKTIKKIWRITDQNENRKAQKSNQLTSCINGNQNQEKKSRGALSEQEGISKHANILTVSILQTEISRQQRLRYKS